MIIKNVLLGISGGIAAYKNPQLVRTLTKQGYSVKCVITKAAEEMVGVSALRTLTGSPVYQDIQDEYDMGHIRLEEWADIFIVAPATANTIAKMAHGIGDNLLSTLSLSLSCPKIIAPAMNVNMWKNSATVSNVDTLVSRGITVLPVGFGELACGVIDEGRMLEPEDIANYIPLHSLRQSLKSKRVLIVSGPTEEALDPVRVLTNRSSGRMGSALTRAALVLGAEVTVISGPSAVPVPDGAIIHYVKSTMDILNTSKALFENNDIIIMVAAISDYRPKEISSNKISSNKGDGIELSLISNPDVASILGELKRDNQTLITFALESSSDKTKAIQKMKNKNSDISVYNKVDESLGKEKSTITIFRKDGKSLVVNNEIKEICAVKIFEMIQ